MKAAEAIIENRRERRMKVFLRVEIRTVPEVHIAHLIDVSRHGAQVHCRASIVVGAFVILECPAISRRAKCVRVKSGRMGLKFIAPLSCDELNVLVHCL